MVNGNREKERIDYEMAIKAIRQMRSRNENMYAALVEIVNKERYKSANYLDELETKIQKLKVALPEVQAAADGTLRPPEGDEVIDAEDILNGRREEKNNG